MTNVVLQQPLPAPSQQPRLAESIENQFKQWHQMQNQVQQVRRDRGTVTRLVDDSLGYLSVPTASEARTLSFSPDVIPKYRGEDWSDIGFYVGSTVDVEWDSAKGVVVSVSLVPREEPDLRARMG